jgi:hypothetical protein
MNRQEQCERIHTDIGDLILEKRGLVSQFEIPMIVENRGDAVACANYLRGHGYDVILQEDMPDCLYLLNVTWK